MTLEEWLADRGFELVQRGRDDSRKFALRSNPYLQWWVTIFADRTAEFTWELELGAYLKAKGFAISVQDELSLLLFPGAERRGPADPEWLVGEIAAAEAQLGSLDFLHGR